MVIKVHLTHVRDVENFFIGQEGIELDGLLVFKGAQRLIIVQVQSRLFERLINIPRALFWL